MVLGEKKFQEKAAELAKIALGQASENGLLVGEAFHGPKEASGAAVLWILDIMWKKRFRVSSFMAD